MFESVQHRKKLHWVVKKLHTFISSAYCSMHIN